MAAKRQRDDQEEDSDIPKDKEIRRIASFSTVRAPVMPVNFHQNMEVTLESVIRKVVREEVDRALSPLFVRRQPQLEMISPEEPASLYRLIFKNQPHTPIFSGYKIEDTDGSPLQILLDANSSSSSSSSSSLPSLIKIEFVVLHGDFPLNEDWTRDEFNKAIVKERDGKRPLLTGDVSNITMRNGYVVTGDLQFSDNSSWTRSRHFRIGVRVVPGSCEPGLIKEAITDKFTVRDHRGESYKKHYPPVLTDEVWRLEKIGRGGVFHQKLLNHNIHNVQDFLKLWAVDQGQLRQILGVGMSERIWETTINHARSCDLGNKIYFYCGQNVAIFLDSICQVVKLTIGGIPYALKDLSKISRDYVEQLVLEAYKQWGSLREADEMFNPNISQIQSEAVVHGGPAGSLQWNDYSSPEFGSVDFQAGDLDEEGTPSRSLPFGYNTGFNFNQMP